MEQVELTSIQAELQSARNRHAIAERELNDALKQLHAAEARRNKAYIWQRLETLEREVEKLRQTAERITADNPTGEKRG